LNPLLRLVPGLRAQPSPWDSAEPIRSGLLSIEHLEELAGSLAGTHQAQGRRVRQRPLSVRLRDNERCLLAAYRDIAAAVQAGHAITPAAEWLLDNYRLIEEQARQGREDLPPGYYRLLPKLASGPLSGYPRVFGIAWDFVAHTDSGFDAATLHRFITAYQRVQPLTIGELWALAITLRIVLIENLRRAASRIVGNRAARREADALADRLLGVHGQAADPGWLQQRGAAADTRVPAFVVQLVLRLRDQDPKVTPALHWIEQQLGARGTTTEEVVREEHQKQGASNVTVRNIITSMRMISDLDWSAFFEGVSLVDARLAAGSDFAAMDFASRNLYRSAIEVLARGSEQSELAIAEAALRAVRAARAAAPPGPSPAAARSDDPGFYLIAAGRPGFAAAVGYRGRFWSWARYFAVARGPRRYLALIALLGAGVLALALSGPLAGGLHGVRLVLLALLGLVPALDVAIALVNHAIMRRVGASVLPSLELRGGVPSQLRTLVVVPTLLVSERSIAAQVARLEVHHLASLEPEIHYALLSDWLDAPTEHAAGDEALLAQAAAAIGLLNARHVGGAGGPRFLLLHRRRVWSKGQRVWMGWERKRGKLHELNQLLRGAAATTFMATTGHGVAVPDGVRYVITLDADTCLPLDAARRLIGKMAHPLNQPQFDAGGGQVLEGHAVLQPRVAALLHTGGEGSRFQGLYSSARGIDPYAAAVSDVYQDLFGEGSYAGKGIYDIDAFEQALAGRVADGALLSHDLFEGLFARAGLASDVQVMEEFPSRYDVATARQHRWVRGDWQLLPWILGRRDRAVAAGQRSAVRLPLIALWKMVDNLRRSLAAPACVAALLAGWLLPGKVALAWTGFVLAAMLLPVWVPILDDLLPRRVGTSLRSHGNALGRELWQAARLSFCLVTLLADQAWLMLDAIVRTLYRLYVSHRNLLQWESAAQQAQKPVLDLRRAYAGMAGAVALAVCVALLVILYQPRNAWLAAPWLLLWLASPVLAVWLSAARDTATAVPEPEVRALRRVARRTWRYFEEFVTPLENCLPPDNFQDDPSPVLAHRTSPTNIGLYLLATACAREFGWAGTLESVERIEATLATLQRLERFRGHFYNWYDTRDLRPLDPRYVSTVDSGNFAAHLLALGTSARAWASELAQPQAAALPAAVHAGTLDALELAAEALQDNPDFQRAQGIGRQHLEAARVALVAALHAGERSALAAGAEVLLDVARGLAVEFGDEGSRDMLFWATAAHGALASERRDAALDAAGRAALALRLERLAASARALALAMEFGFLFDQDRRLLAIGYCAPEGVLDPSCYDLLASEARLASFIAIAKHDVPAAHWFRLGRSVTPVGQGAALMSWSGSMFEYLMPSLVLRAPAGSLLEQSNRLIVRRQRQYGVARGVPWGISESAYNARDIELTYQYSNFGVPGLGLKRGLSENLVVAPYATALAAMVDPVAALANLQRLESLGALGRYGYHEAIDFTRLRLPEGASSAVVHAWMAHHQGMTVAALANVLLQGLLRARFHSDPLVRAAELLMQERAPRDVPVRQPHTEEVASTRRLSDVVAPQVRRHLTAHDAVPQTQVLANGRYSLLLTAAGSGYSRWGELAVTRWREDGTCDEGGSCCFLRDVASGEAWSCGYQPAGVEPERYEVTFTEDRAEILRVDGTMTTLLEVLVSPEDDAEVRRVSLSNAGHHARDFDVTSYCELVLAPPAADLAHPAFLKLFVQTEYVAKPGALLATRRRRAPEEPGMWVAHSSVVEGECLRPPEYETDRARFIGRGRELREAISVFDGRRLSNTVGTVLDPVFALRQRVRVPAGGTARISFWTFVADSREAVLQLLGRHQEPGAFLRAGTLAWTQGQVQLRHLGSDAGEASLFQRLAGQLLFAQAALRPFSATLVRGAGGPQALWALGISGDRPILLLRIDDLENIDIARQLLRAQEYWRMKQVAVDLVILNERASSYIQDLQSALESQLRMSRARPRLGDGSAGGGVFILRSDLIPEQARALLFSVARVVLSGQRGSLATQLERQREPAMAVPPQAVARQPGNVAIDIAPPPGLEFFNGIGGFVAAGREYLVRIGPGQVTPAPWINVIANPQFGFQVSAEGAGYTWSRNSRDNQLTPWSNDPVSDRPGEVLYVRDEETGALWGPTAAPVRDPRSTYSAWHGQGYSRFGHRSQGISLELLMFVPLADPVKVARLRLHNNSTYTRSLSVTAYAECVLGPSRQASAAHLITECDPVTGALLARNPWGSGRTGFADLGGTQQGWTCDRREFIGRNGSLARPAALATLAPLARRAGAGLDPCWALQRRIVLKPGESLEVVFLLGEAGNEQEARDLLLRYRSLDLDECLERVVGFWDELLGSVQVRTPERAFDLMMNRWLLYQALACRIWARAGFYQASGAYGFRDQLQDGMALAAVRPALTREHLLRAAGRQFSQGDVQHWWLPDTGQGVRTRISDDRVWLAYATARYLLVSGDAALLDEPVPFIEGQLLRAEEHDAFFQPVTSDEMGTMYEHCARALDASLQRGGHGLPLIGTGDWNDGLNRVGAQGRGESIWLGWFLHATLTGFAPLAEARADLLRAARWRAHAAALGTALEQSGWDGAWYRRAYYDDGTPLGSGAEAECRIDAIAQSWAVLSGAADPVRAARAMAEVSAQLIVADPPLALLFTPPFADGPGDPGYIKGYPAGLRENGGQYTHAALWSVMALAGLGQGTEAAALLALLNPVNRANSRAGVLRYKLEPYVVAADVYSVAPHAGRGGWSWYTGAAGWMHRAGLEAILGVQRRGEALLLAPCLPAHWPQAVVTLRHRSASYEITIENPHGGTNGVESIEVDGLALAAGVRRLPLQDDGALHAVRVRLAGPARDAPALRPVA
jgi:cyclic beta-1,2-glucan synthetase